MDPYIGITDFTSFEQVERMLGVFRRHQRSGSNRRLHVGVMMSYKTLNGIETKWAQAFPPKEKIHSIFESDEVLNCLHYADYDGVDVVQNVSRAIEYCGMYIDAVQFDMIWPEPADVANVVHISRKPLEAILQLDRRALEDVDYDPTAVVIRLEDYETVIHRVLLDASMGRGVDLDAEKLLPIAWAIRNRFPELGLTVAGGLGPNSLHLIAPLIKEFPDLSIDAQGKLRPSGSALDPIDWDMAEQYLVRALELLP